MKKLILSLLLLTFLTTPVYAERMRKFDSIASQDARYWRKLTADTGLTGDKTGSFDIATTGTGEFSYVNVTDETTGYQIDGSSILFSTGTENVFCGVGAAAAITGGNYNAVFGARAGENLTTGDYNVFIGDRAGNNITGGTYNILIGESSVGALAGTTASIGIGVNAAPASNECVIGTTTASINDMYIGRGQYSGSPFGASGGVTLHATGGYGTNEIGAALMLAGGKGTGNASSGVINFQTSTPGASGSTLRSLSTRWTIDGTGHLLSGTDGTGAYNITTTGELVSGDMGIRDSSPKLSFSDSTDDTAYAFHLDQADSTWGYFQLWEGTDADGKSFQIGSSFRKPAFYIDTNNLFHAPYGIDADTGNITTTGTGTFGGASAGQSTIDSGLVVNSLGGAAAADDFRCETTSEVNAFVVDASADEIIANVDLVVNDITILTPSAAQAVTVATYTILANATMIVLDPNANYTLTSAPTIANGTTGQILYITAGNAEANTVTVQDQGTLASSNLQLGGATRIIAAKSVLTLLFDGVNWLEIAYQIS